MISDLSIERSVLLPYVYRWEKCWNDSFARIIEGWPIKLGTGIKLINNLDTYQYQGRLMTCDLCFKVAWFHIFRGYLLWKHWIIFNQISWSIHGSSERKFVQMVLVFCHLNPYAFIWNKSRAWYLRRMCVQLVIWRSCTEGWFTAK